MKTTRHNQRYRHSEDDDLTDQRRSGARDNADRLLTQLADPQMTIEDSDRYRGHDVRTSCAVRTRCEMMALAHTVARRIASVNGDPAEVKGGVIELTYKCAADDGTALLAAVLPWWAMAACDWNRNRCDDARKALRASRYSR
ncbi:hypothetical protein [Nocardia sp. CA-120079]|uniref:hypothetical protein n=1 Tax=Nocardia sp. CA-120079 TaxID=3239974 RepID=UPI003D998641